MFPGVGELSDTHARSASPRSPALWWDRIAKTHLSLFPPTSSDPSPAPLLPILPPTLGAGAGRSWGPLSDGAGTELAAASEKRRITDAQKRGA